MKYIMKSWWWNKRISLWLILLLILIKGASQHNLVPNYSFENYAICPNFDSLFSPPPPPWYLPTKADYQCCTYANACSTTGMGVPYNVIGALSYQYARTGQAYELIISYSTDSIGVDRSYIQTKLIDSLKKNKKYYCEFYISLANVSSYASNNISMLFTRQAVYMDTGQSPYIVIPATAQIVNYGNPIIDDTLHWVKVSGIYKAQDNEQFITIGNFKYDNQTNTKIFQLNGTTSGSTYYLDDVSVIPLDSICLKADAGRDTTIKQGDSVFIGSYTNGIDSLLWLQNGTIPKDSTRPGFYVSPTTTTFYVLHQIVNGCYSSDTVTVNVTIVPLRMMSYEASPTPPKEGLVSVLNKWQTMNEVNVSHYNIERSINGKDFITVGKVRANNKVLNEYRYTDDRLPSTVDSKLYYRLEIVDKDGSKTYSEIKSVDRRPFTVNSISVYPNPSNGNVTIECADAKELSIIDYLGRTVHQSTVNSQPTTVNTKQFTKGIYIVKAVMNNGEIKTKKLMVE